jgi:hypothetical protein
VKTNPSADRFRALEAVFESAAQRRAYSVVDPSARTIRSTEFADHHRNIEALALSGPVPEELRDHFDTARNLLLYAWFVWEFIPVAELHAYGSVEMALRTRLGYEQDGDGPTLRRLFNEAIQRTLLHDLGFRHFHRRRAKRREFAELLAQAEGSEMAPEPPPDPQAYCRVLARWLPYFRNRLAHGSRMNMGHGLWTLELCADVINQLYAG